MPSRFFSFPLSFSFILFISCILWIFKNLNIFSKKFAINFILLQLKSLNQPSDFCFNVYTFLEWEPQVCSLKNLIGLDMGLEGNLVSIGFISDFPSSVLLMQIFVYTFPIVACFFVFQLSRILHVKCRKITVHFILLV